MQISTSLLTELGTTVQSSAVIVSNLVDAGTATCTKGTILINFVDTGKSSVKVKNSDRVSVNTVSSETSSETVYNYLAINGQDVLLHIVSSRSDPRIVTTKYLQDKSYEDVRSYPSGFPFRPKFDTDLVTINGIVVNLTTVGATTNTTTVPVIRYHKNEVALVSTSDFRVRATITGLSRPIDAVYANSLHWIAFNGSNVLNAYNSVGVVFKSFSITNPRFMVLQGSLLYISSSDGLVVINTTSYEKQVYPLIGLDKLVIRSGFIYATDRTNRILRKINLTTFAETSITLPGYPTTLTVFGADVLVGIPATDTIYKINASDQVSAAIVNMWTPISILGVGTKLYIADLLTKFIYEYDSTLNITNATQCTNSPVRLYAYNGGTIFLDFHSNFPVSKDTNDQTPQPVQFVQFESVAKNQYYTSNEVMIDGINTPIRVSIPPKTDGYLVINGTNSGTSASVIYSDRIKIVLKSSDVEGVAVDARLAYGTKSATFSLPSPTVNRRIAKVVFTPITDATIDTLYSSNEVTISGLDLPVQARVSQGSIIKNNVNVGSSTTLTNSDKVKIQLRSGPVPGDGVISVFTADTFETYFAVGNESPPVGLVMDEYKYLGPYGMELPTNEVSTPGETPEDPPIVTVYTVYPESSHNQLTTVNYFSDQTYSSKLQDPNTGKFGVDEDTLTLIRPKYSSSSIIVDRNNSIVECTSKVTTSSSLFGKLGLKVDSVSVIRISDQPTARSIEFNVEFPDLPTSNFNIFTSSEVTISVSPAGIKINSLESSQEWHSNTRYHIAVDSGKAFLNGALLGSLGASITSLTNPKFQSSESILINEIRISRVSRFSTEFVAPTTPYGDYRHLGVTTDYYNDQIQLVDLESCAILRTIQLPPQSHPFDTSIFESKIAVSLTGSNLVKIYDLSSFDELEEIPVDSPKGLTYLTDGSLNIVSDSSVIKIKDGVRTSTSVGVGPLHILADSTDRLWVSHSGSDSIYVISSSVDIINVGIAPWNMVESDRYIYVGVTGTNQVKAISKATLEVLKTATVGSIPYYLSTLITGQVVIGYFGESLVDIYDSELTARIKAIRVSDSPITGILTSYDTISIVSMYHNIPARTESLPPSYLFSNTVINDLPRTYSMSIDGTVESKSEIDVVYPQSSNVVLKKNGQTYKGKYKTDDTYQLTVTSSKNNYEDSLVVPVLTNGNLQTLTGVVGPRLTPDQFYFNPISSAVKNVEYRSEAITISGIKAGKVGSISAPGAIIYKNDVYSGDTTSITNGDRIQIGAVAKGIYGQVTRYLITSGEMFTYFDLSTVEVGNPIQDYSWTKYYNQSTYPFISIRRKLNKLAMGTTTRKSVKIIRLAKGNALRPLKRRNLLQGSLASHTDKRPTAGTLNDFKLITYERDQFDPLNPSQTSDLPVILPLSSHLENAGHPHNDIDTTEYYDVNTKVYHEVDPPTIVQGVNSQSPQAAAVFVQAPNSSAKIFLDMTIEDPNTFYNFDAPRRGSKTVVNPSYKTPELPSVLTIDPEFKESPNASKYEFSFGFATKTSSGTTLGVGENYSPSHKSKVVIVLKSPEIVNITPTDIVNPLSAYEVRSRAGTNTVIKDINLVTMHKPRIENPIGPLNIRSVSKSSFVRPQIGPKLQAAVIHRQEVVPIERNVDHDRYLTGFTCDEIGAYADKDSAMATCIAKGLSDCNTFTVANSPCYMWYSPTFYGSFSVPAAWYLGGG